MSEVCDDEGVSVVVRVVFEEDAVGCREPEASACCCSWCDDIALTSSLACLRSLPEPPVVGESSRSDL